MTDEEQFIAAIHAAPREDTLRLVYADWLDERGADGDADRAAFIRCGIECPDELFWPTEGPWPRARHAEGARLFESRWRSWREERIRCLGTSPLAKWLRKDDTHTDRWPDCCWAYRRGFVSVLDTTEQVLLDAGADVFKLGPVDEVRVLLSDFAAVPALHTVLEAPSVRVLRLRARAFRARCLGWARGADEWFQRYDAVELDLFVMPGREWGINHAAIRELCAWLASEPALRHVTFGSGFGTT